MYRLLLSLLFIVIHASVPLLPVGSFQLEGSTATMKKISNDNETSRVSVTFQLAGETYNFQPRAVPFSWKTKEATCFITSETQQIPCEWNEDQIQLYVDDQTGFQIIQGSSSHDVYAAIRNTHNSFELIPNHVNQTVQSWFHSDYNPDDYQCGNAQPENAAYEFPGYTIDEEPIHTAIPPEGKSMKAAAAAIDPGQGNAPPLKGPFPALWDNCYPGQEQTRIETLGLAYDYGAFVKLGSSVSAVQTHAATLILYMNYIYASQVHLRLTLQSLNIQTSPQTGIPWNYQPSTCPPTIGNALDALTAWRSSLTDPTQQASVWQLQTACFQPPGVVGLAWINSLCSVRYSTSVMSLFPGNYLLAAHELGHNHGANHSWPANQPSLQGKVGGIMDYGPGYYPYPKTPQSLYQFHPTICKPLVCSAVKQALSGQCSGGGCVTPLSRCFQAANPARCGNGIVERDSAGGEECDDGDANNGSNESCCTKTCKWKKKTLCDSFQNKNECCNLCIPRLTRRFCSENKGYCGVNGTCQSSNTCTKYGFQLCGMDPANACMLQCRVNGQCNSMQGWRDSQTGEPLNMQAVDGSVCVRNPLQVCRQGKCVSAES